MADSRAAGIFAALRAAAEAPAAPFLLSVSDPDERARLRRALIGDAREPKALDTCIERAFTNASRQSRGC